MAIPILKYFFQLLGNKAYIFLPSVKLNKRKRFRSLLLSLKPLKVLCSSILPSSLLVKQLVYFESLEQPVKDTSRFIINLALK